MYYAFSKKGTLFKGGHYSRGGYYLRKYGRNSITGLTLTSNIGHLFDDRMKGTRAFQTDAAASQRHLQRIDE